LPKVSPSHLYKEETFHPHKYKLYFEKLPKFPKKEKIFCDGSIKLVNCQNENKVTMNFGSISLIKKSNKLVWFKACLPFFFNPKTKIYANMGTSNFTYIQGYE
jgi:hypothetical protein